MTKGRKPKPSSLKVIEGNTARRPAKKELKAKAVMPPKPKTLSEAARKVWDEVAPELAELGVLARVDATTLETFCNNLVMMRRLQRFIDENGYSYTTETKNGIMHRQFPEVGILQKCQTQHRAFMSEFGMSPASRTRLPDASQGDLFGSDSPWGDYAG